VWLSAKKVERTERRKRRGGSRKKKKKGSPFIKGAGWNRLFNQFQDRSTSEKRSPRGVGVLSPKKKLQGRERPEPTSEWDGHVEIRRRKKRNRRGNPPKKTREELPDSSEEGGKKVRVGARPPKKEKTGKQGGVFVRGGKRTPKEDKRRRSPSQKKGSAPKQNGFLPKEKVQEKWIQGERGAPAFRPRARKGLGKGLLFFGGGKNNLNHRGQKKVS